MSTDLSPENEQFIQAVVRSGTFTTRGEALDMAVELLKRRQELLDHIDEGTRQLGSGESRQYAPSDVDHFLQDIRAAKSQLR
jgi:Arc/MetJ-type ribon-helix-helix transcriptional regulator